jgi:hypothetical protein
VEDDEAEEPGNGQDEEADGDGARFRAQLGPDQGADGQDEGKEPVVGDAAGAGGNAIAGSGCALQSGLVAGFGRL